MGAERFCDPSHISSLRNSSWATRSRMERFAFSVGDVVLHCDGGWICEPVLGHLEYLKSDRSQREILLAAAKSTFVNGSGSQKRAEEIEWICKRADALEDSRNDALHSPLWATPRGPSTSIVSPVVGLGHVRANKLLGKNLLTEFQWCRECSTLLRDYATELDFAVCRGRALPDRPKLPSRNRQGAASSPRKKGTRRQAKR
jgi:hypothetical protein